MMGRIYIFLVISLIHIFSVYGNDQADECNLIQYYLEGVGLSIFAGKTYYPEDILDIDIGFPIEHKIMFQNELDVYVGGYNETHTAMYLGLSMLVNHEASADGGPLMIEQLMPEEDSDTVLKHDSNTAHSLVNTAIHTIEYGEQIFIPYEDNWFQARGYSDNMVQPCNMETDFDFSRPYCRLNPNDIHHPATFRRLPGCFFSTSDYRNKRVYANRNIAKGEYIIIARAILIPEEQAQDSGYVQQFAWFKKRLENECPKRNAMILFGYGSLFQSPESGDSVVNVDIQWWNVNEYIQNAEKVFQSSGSLLDYRTFAEEKDVRPRNPKEFLPNNGEEIGVEGCANRSFIAFIANRDIRLGEELTIPLENDPSSPSRFAPNHITDFCF